MVIVIHLVYSIIASLLTGGIVLGIIVAFLVRIAMRANGKLGSHEIQPVRSPVKTKGEPSNIPSTPFIVLSRRGLRSLRMNANSQPEEVIALWGEPVGSWDDGVEKCMEYELPGLEIEFLWRVNGHTFDFNYVDIEIPKNDVPPTK